MAVRCVFVLHNALVHVDHGDERPILGGVLIQVKDEGRVDVVSTNSYTLYLCECDWREFLQDGAADESLWLPGPVLAEAVAAARKARSSIQLDCTVDHGNTEGEMWTANRGWRISHLRYGYPNYRQLIPPDDGLPIEVPAFGFNPQVFGSILKMSQLTGMGIRKYGGDSPFSIRAIDPLKPVVLRPCNDPPGYKQMVLAMPVRL